MANIKSQKKRVRTNEIRRQRNVAVKSKVKTLMKQTLTAIASKDLDAVAKILPVALSEIDRAATKGVYHANNAARKKSSLQGKAAGLASA